MSDQQSAVDAQSAKDAKQPESRDEVREQPPIDKKEGAADGQHNQAPGPRQLLSHYRGMPRQWEKNKGKLPPLDNDDKTS
ncbi:hypothetical protein F5Y15DRAFT_411269 [Xylariaceae sp. FL0016]|nr:hypothetical protein F5Y15DRAFT_411269 [Xylariaceae sp. FL0016]